MPQYTPETIEPKWQRIWQERAAFQVEMDRHKPKYYILDMFPYPSHTGLHVGHLSGYTATDVIARYKRQQGYNVLHPMGWDSFGLPAEQHALRTGQHPLVTTKKNVANYRRQLQALGFSYDWSRELATSDPTYYKWTQWIFGKLYQQGLAYEAELPVNFCPQLGTVLANEEIAEGRSKEGGYVVERRPLRQWMLKITSYAERLLEDLDLLEWPESLKKMQRGWIGRSPGVKLRFALPQHPEAIEIFTTRPETLFGVTFVALAPEHPAVERLASNQQMAAIAAYRQQSAAKSDLQRTDLGKERSGVFTGAYALHPLTGKPIPIWIADYVLSGVQTGAVMGVPAHDERDFAFAQALHLPMIPVIDPDRQTEVLRKEVQAGTRCWSGEGRMMRSHTEGLTLDGLSCRAARQQITTWLQSTGQGSACVSYKLRDWLFSRQRYWGEPIPILHFADGSKRALDLDELPLLLPHLDQFRPPAEGYSPLQRATEWRQLRDPHSGRPAVREMNTMPQWAGSCWYYLRFCDPHNENRAWEQQKERYWMPVDLYVGGMEHAVLHLLYARFWHKVLYDCGLVSSKEPFRCLRTPGLIIAPSYRLAEGQYVHSSEVVQRGANWWHLPSGSAVTMQMEKMSKSKLNGVSPDQLVADFGADAVRLYILFMGPFDKEKVWTAEGIRGCQRFLQRFYTLLHAPHSDAGDPLLVPLVHRLIADVQRDLEQLSFNTAIAKMMEFLNVLTARPRYPKAVVEILTRLLYPFAPHLAEEGWQILGQQSSLVTLPFPVADPHHLSREVVLYPVQVDGRLRGRWEFPSQYGEEEIVSFLRQQPAIAKHLCKGVRRVVFVAGRLVNFVVGDEVRGDALVRKGKER